MKRKSFYLQTLYLQKPLLLIVFIAIVATIPWIGLGDFYTKGEPREASLAISMIQDGNWIIPFGYADEFAYKPPLNHWLIAGFSYLFNDGEVTPFTSRLPSALGFIGLIWISFMFFARRRPPLEAFIACLILITCFEIHRAAMTSRLDMLLTFFSVAGLLQLYVWWEKKKVRYVLSACLFLILATLVKGPVGVILPCVIFGIFLLFQRENFFKVFGKCLLVAIPALLIPFIWYYLAYQIKGDEFANLVIAENFGRFLSLEDASLGIKYKLGQEQPWWFYVPSLLAGFVPWTLLLVISLFFLKYSKPSNPIKQSIINWWNKFSKDKVSLFSLIIIVVTVLLFTIPTSKRSVYIMTVYPFIALFMARYMIYLVQEKPKAVRIFTCILLGIAVLALIIVGLSYIGVIDLENMGLSKRERTLHDIKVFSDLFKAPTILGFIMIIILLYAVGRSIFILRKHSNIKILMAAFGIMFAINLFQDGFLLPAFKNSYSSRPYAEYLSKKYDLKGNTYVMNNLLNYANMYGLNFYLGNNFKNFEKEQPSEGYFITGDMYMDSIKVRYPDYNFIELEKNDRYTDYRLPMVLFKIEKNK